MSNDEETPSAEFKVLSVSTAGTPCMLTDLGPNG